MTATVAGWVWVDGLSAQQRDNLRARLTVRPRKTTDIAAARTPAPILLYREDGDRIGVPRGYWQRSSTGVHAERLAVSYGAPMRPLRSTWTAEGPFAEQAQIVAALQASIADRPWGGGILEAGCRTGKTFCATEFAHRVGGTTMILVHKEFLLKQWREDIGKILPGARVGLVQQGVCEWEGMDFVIGLLPSLALEDGSRYDQRLYQAFRTVVCDEVHRMGAATFAAVIANFSAAYRVGLSATLDRADGANAVFFDQIGPVVYTATSRSMTPKLRVLTSRAVLRDIRRGRYAVDKDQLNSAQVITQLAEDAGRQRLIVDQILRAIKVGRKILVMSERLEQLRAMWLQVRAAVPALGVPWAVEHGFCTGQWFAAERGKKMRNVTDAEFARAQSAQVIWASKQLIEEGYTNPALDVFVLGTPVGNVEQAASRARGFCTPTPGQCERLCPWRAGRCAGKEDTVIVDVIDPEVPSVQSKWRKRQRLYREMGVKVGA